MYQAAMYQASLTGVSTLSVLNHVVPPSLKPRRSLWVPEVLKVSELLCAVSFSCLQQVTMFYSYQQVLHFCCHVQRVDPVPGKMLCKALGASMKEPPSLRCCLWWLPLNDLPAFTPAFFQAVPCIAATRTRLSPMTHAAPALATAPTTFGAVRFLNTVCRWQAHVHPRCFLLPLLSPWPSPRASVLLPMVALLFVKCGLSPPSQNLGYAVFLLGGWGGSFLPLLFLRVTATVSTSASFKVITSQDSY